MLMQKWRKQMAVRVLRPLMLSIRFVRSLSHPPSASEFGMTLRRHVRRKLLLADLAVVQYRHNPHATHDVAEGRREQPLQVGSRRSRPGES